MAATAVLRRAAFGRQSSCLWLGLRQMTVNAAERSLFHAKRVFPSLDMAAADWQAAISPLVEKADFRACASAVLQHISQDVCPNGSDDEKNEAWMAAADIVLSSQYGETDIQCDESTTTYNDIQCRQDAGMVLLSVPAATADLSVFAEMQSLGVRAAFRLAQMLRQRGDVHALHAAFKIFSAIARFGDGMSLFFLGCMKLRGEGAAANLLAGMQILQQAALRGVVAAYQVMGDAYASGEEADLELAMEYYRLGAEAGHVACMNSRAFLLLQPQDGLSVHGLTPDAQEAYSLFTRAAQLGSAEGSYNLGLCYRNGVGTAVDMDEARKHFRSAAEAGFAPAAYNLAVMLEQGPDAEKWFKFAEQSGIFREEMLKQG